MKNKTLLALVAGFVVGTVWLVGIRFVTYKNDHVHYHANFALYINGQRDEFNNFTFYEEVQSCGTDEHNDPKTRVHMHDNVNHTVHVHDNGATWGHFFANLGYTLGNDLIKTDSDGYIDGVSENKLTFILNGKEEEAIANRTIQSEDALLISYGNEDSSVLNQRFGAITKDAGEYNQKNDPASCAGSKPLTTTERLKKAIGIED